ncbi:MAG: YfcE family phosphodiesterase [Planctomycetaceae bacterium]
MRIGIFADAHDHVDNVRRAVAEFNARQCDLVVFAGDFVSPIVVPPLRKLACRVLACFGDNEGNRPGIQGGMRIIGLVAEPPFCFRATDGTRVLVTHQLDKVRDHFAGCDVVISAHTHRPGIVRDREGRVFVNPGETSGWTYRKPSIAILETETREAYIVPLPEMPATCP